MRMSVRAILLITKNSASDYMSAFCHFLPNIVAISSNSSGAWVSGRTNYLG